MNLSNIFKENVLHPYFFVAFIILFLYKENIHQLELVSLITPLLISLITTFFLVLLSKKITKEKYRAGIITSVFVLFFFNYGRIMDMRDSPPHVAAWLWKSVLLISSIGLICLMIYWFSKRNNNINLKAKKIYPLLIVGFLLTLLFYKQLFSVLKNFHPLTVLYFITNYQVVFIALFLILLTGLTIALKWKNEREYSSANYYLNFFSAILIILVMLQMGWYYASENENSESQQYMPVTFQTERVEAALAELPDIYYIIPDGYAGQHTLKNSYDFDNSYFLAQLQQRGFYIANESRANYLTTFISLTSSLNMDYIDFLKENPGISSKDRTIPYYLIDYNNAATILKSLGYHYIQFSSGWAATEDNAFADRVYDVHKLNEFQFVFLRSTPLRFFLPNERITTLLYNIEKVKEVPLEKSPKFIFLHLEIPHPPFLFDKKGKTIADEVYDPSGKQWANKERYIEQLQFTNQKILDIVDAIQQTSQNPPIIIIQGDHGTDTVLNWITHPTTERLNERSYILNAYYLPKGGEEVLYPTISPVNTFRVIFNYYFNQNYLVLDDVAYFSDYYNTPYNFVEIFRNGEYTGSYSSENNDENDIVNKNAE